MTAAPVNFHTGVWSEDSLAARITIREMYRRERRSGVAPREARQAARTAALTIAYYNENVGRVGS